MRQIFIAVLIGLLANTALAAERTTYTRNVAVVIYKDAEPLDWTGPYEVWNDAANFGQSNGQRAFNVYTVSKTTEPLSSQGMKIVPDYSIANAPKPDIIVIPGGNSANVYDDAEFLAWAKKAATEAEVAETVCTGVFVLAKTGLLDNLEATTWYGAIDHLREGYPAVKVKNGQRFVDNGHFVTTAGVSAGIDGSLHLIARLLGRRVADQVARYMEYRWTPESYLSTTYAYFNPSTNDRGRLVQQAEVDRDNKDFTAAAKIYRALLTDEPKNAGVLAGLAHTLQKLDDHQGAAEAFSRAAANDSNSAYLYYEAAQEYAKSDDTDRAVTTLRKAWDAGFHQRDALLKDPILAKIRNDARFKSIVEAE